MDIEAATSMTGRQGSITRWVALVCFSVAVALLAVSLSTATPLDGSIVPQHIGAFAVSRG